MMSASVASHKAQCLCIDIETARTDRLQIKEIGAYRPDTAARARIPGTARDLLGRLDALTTGAAFLLGHNVIAHDQPALAQLYPDLRLHALPVIDTLELSPVAFPQNPYHRLVKDYKLCTTTRNDPVRDAELAFELFLDQREALLQQVETNPDATLCLHFLLAPENGKGVANVFATLRRTLRPTLFETRQAWVQATEGKGCLTAQRALLEDQLPDPEWHKPLAYALAWLGVAGGNSVLPPWVLHAFPKTREVISRLRDTPCNDPECGWCQEQHNLVRLLHRYFPHMTDFRAKPALPDGQSLQRTIVQNGFADKSTLAILPTGGGKSLCFQLPALARFYRTGSLTVVISPLQSLMKDQVDNLIAAGVTCAGYLNSLLMPIERRAMLDNLRLGDLGLIFVAPEQFRSTAFANALRHRQVAAWVFDEAHCLSKWGHDFRPDYLYVSRFIKNLQGKHPSPVFCFTATAKPDVVKDICEHFVQRLAIELTTLEGGVQRENLDYEVRAVPVQAKYSEVLRLFQETLREQGSAIVFSARQKTVEELAAFLKTAGVDCGHFHGGLPAEKKRAVQEAFIGGGLRLIAATNAFGMGVDKADVRLVVHLDTPGSLENYLQEAGRAGRDQQPARCVLLYDDADLDVQFRLLRNSRLTQHDIHAILKALRQIERKDRSNGEVVATSGEILLETPESHRIDPDAAHADTKVRIAVSWLEEAHLLERHENHNRIFPGSLLVTTIEEARGQLAKKLPPTAVPTPYLAILSALMHLRDDEGLSTDELMLATGCDSRTVQAMLRELDRWGLLADEQEIGVTLYRDPDTSARLDFLRRLETVLLAQLREAAPDADRESWQILNTRRLCDILRRDAGGDFSPDKLSRLLKSFAESFGEGNGQRGFFALRPGGADSRQVKLLRNWQDIDAIRQKRMRVAEAVVKFFLDQRQGNNQLVVCKQAELEKTLGADVTLTDIQDWDTAVSAALLYLDQNEVLHLARGKAVLRTAMRIELNTTARRRQFSKTDYAELALHYSDKIVQVQVMAEYARLALRKAQEAMMLVMDYFRLDRATFVQRYFAGRKEVLEMAASEAAHRKILIDLKSPDQQAIVTASTDSNHLVLAGPGAGKTRVIVHRIAWLVRLGLVLPETILVLTYNREAAAEIRRRLWALIGTDAGGVCVQTLHSLALRLTGTSLAVASERGEVIDFDAVIQTATALLKKTDATDNTEAAYQRDRVLSGLRHVLVDEYQDINAAHYDFISAIVGRALENAEDKLSLLAVGDDDQNIYTFGGANVDFIRRFEADYQARRHLLTENYRSIQHIIDCANELIAPARNRMKPGQPIRINHARRPQPAGGELATLDPVTEGRVHILETPSGNLPEASAAFAELMRINTVAGYQRQHWGRFAVIARHGYSLQPLANLCRLHGIPARLLRDKNELKLHQTREGAHLLALLNGAARKTRQPRILLRAATLSRWFRRCHRLSIDALIEHPQRATLAQFIAECETTAPGSDHIASNLVDAVYEFGTGRQRVAESAHNPITLLTAHKAKGQEFDHVLILDSNGWQSTADDERRVFYVAMTRARKSLTLCERQEGNHAFSRDCKLAIRTRPQATQLKSGPIPHVWVAELGDIHLDWPGQSPVGSKTHQAIARLDYASPLALRESPADARWELIDISGNVVGRMAKRFKPPLGEILSVRVSSIAIRHARQSNNKNLCPAWELILPEIEYIPDTV